MDEDRIGGVGKKAVGSVKESLGKLTVDRSFETEGAAGKTSGTARNTVGGIKATVHDVAEK